MFSRIALFLLTNFAVLILAGIVMSVVGVDPNKMSGLLVFAAIFIGGTSVFGGRGTLYGTCIGAIIIGGGPLAEAAETLAASVPVPVIGPIPAAMRLLLARLATKGNARD